MGKTQLNRVAAYVEPHLHEELNKICQQNGCTMSVLINRFIENQLSFLANSNDSFSSSSSLADSAETTLLENQVSSLQSDLSNLQAVVAELRNNPENEPVQSVDSAVTQLVSQLAQPGENLRNKPTFTDEQAQASSAELDKSQLTQLKRHMNQLEEENEKLQAELEEINEQLEEAFQEISFFKEKQCSLEIELMRRDLSYLINSFNHVVERKALISELEQHKIWVRIACEISKIRR